MNFPVKCACGDDSRYQNMANGNFIYTCGKYGCKKEKPPTYKANTNLMGDHLIGKS